MGGVPKKRGSEDLESHEGTELWPSAHYVSRAAQNGCKCLVHAEAMGIWAEQQPSHRACAYTVNLLLDKLMEEGRVAYPCMCVPH